MKLFVFTSYCLIVMYIEECNQIFNFHLVEGRWGGWLKMTKFSFLIQIVMYKNFYEQIFQLSLGDMSF